MRFRLVIAGKPVPLQRSRTRDGRHYLPRRSRAFRELVQVAWLQGGRPSLGDAPCALAARFYGANARADTDNLVKAIADALNGLAFADDCQIVCLADCRKLPADAAGARSEVELWTVDRPAAVA